MPDLTHSLLPLFLVLAPAIGALAMLLPIKEFTQERAPWAVALLTSLVGLGIAIATAVQQIGLGHAMGFSATWIEQYGVDFALYADGVSAWFVLLIGIISPLVIIASRGEVGPKPKSYYLLILLLEAALMGTFLATDLIVFYVFFELTLVPIFFLLAGYGLEKGKQAAATYFIYALTGSMLTFAAIMYLGYHHSIVQEGQWSFALADLSQTAPALIYETFTLNLVGITQIQTSASHLVLLGLLAGFLVKVPLWPIHHYLPLAHSQAPAHGAVDLAGLVLKLGPFAVLKFALPLCPNAAVDLAPAIGVLAIISILAMGLVSWVLQDAKKLLAYSSVSHMGFVVLGLFAFDADGLGASGALFYILAYTLSAGALFLLLGMLYKRIGTFQLSEFSGLATKMPVWAFFTVFFTMASVGLPGLNGFVGEFLTMLATYRSPEGVLGPAFATVSVIGVIVAAMYLLRMVGKAAFGPYSTPASVTKLNDLTGREILVLAPLAVLCLVLGLMPQPILSSMQTTADVWTSPARQAAQQVAQQVNQQSVQKEDVTVTQQIDLPTTVPFVHTKSNTQAAIKLP